jgi:hypothetical protein
MEEIGKLALTIIAKSFNNCTDYCCMSENRSRTPPAMENATRGPFMLSGRVSTDAHQQASRETHEQGLVKPK